MWDEKETRLSRGCQIELKMSADNVNIFQNNMWQPDCQSSRIKGDSWAEQLLLSIQWRRHILVRLVERVLRLKLWSRVRRDCRAGIWFPDWIQTLRALPGLAKVLRDRKGIFSANIRRYIFISSIWVFRILSRALCTTILTNH